MFPMTCTGVCVCVCVCVRASGGWGKEDILKAFIYLRIPNGRNYIIIGIGKGNLCYEITDLKQQ